MINESPAEGVKQFPDDCLPPESVYESRDALFEAITAWSKSRGYAFTTARSQRSTNGRITVTYACDKFHHNIFLLHHRVCRCSSILLAVGALTLFNHKTSDYTNFQKDY